MTTTPGRTSLLTSLALALGSAALALAPTATPGTVATPEAAASAAAPSSSAAPGRRPAPLTGQWRMTSLQVRTDGTFEEVPYSGQLLFTRAGTLAVQAMNPDPEAADTAYTVDGYEAYYGPVRVDRKERSFTIRVASAAVRDLIGQRLTRNFQVDRGRLVVTPVDPAEGFRVTYERVR